MTIPHKLNRAASKDAAQRRFPWGTLLIGTAMMVLTACRTPSFSSGASMMELLQNCKTDEERERLNEERRFLRPRMAYYGKVVDMQGNPIPNAAVHLSWYPHQAAFVTRAPYEKTVRTDKNGCFKKWGFNIWNFYVTASKEGYAPEPVNQLENLTDHPWHSKKDPVLITLRELGPQTFLIISPFAGQWTEDVFRIKGTNSVSHPLDLLAWQSSRQWKDSTPANADLWIDADFDAMGQRWNITYSITNGPGGIVLSDEMLYEAPAEGYAPSVSVAFTNGYKQRKYLYVRSRTPSVYSRIMFVHGVSVGEGGVYLNVACTAWVNPYGDRSLEFDGQSDSAVGLAESLRDEALVAWAAGRYPERKEDMGKLAEEIRERLKRETEESNRRNAEWAERIRQMDKEKAEKK